MDKETLQAFAARATQANRSQLVVIVYEIILKDIEEAKKAMEAGSIDIFKRELQHGQKFLSELISTLDFNYVISLDLMQLYLYVNKRIIMAVIKEDTKLLDSAQTVLGNLLQGFEGVAREDKSEPVMINTQQVYAGLTYGKGTLNETYMDPNQQSRGFKV